MMLKLFTCLLLSLLLLAGNLAVAQSNNREVDSTMMSRISFYGIKNRNPSMFVHLDKTLYVNNETIWFTAYLLNCNKTELPKHEVLSAFLVSDNDLANTFAGKFIMANGIAYGSLIIPDTIPAGNYNFVAYTNRMLNNIPVACFTQHITIKSAAQPTFDVALSIDTLYKDAANLRVFLQADNKSAPLNGALISYYLGKGQRGGVAGKTKTSILGSCTMLIPKHAIMPAQHNLEVQVKYGDEIKILHLPIPARQLQQAIDVHFYPEGGHLLGDIRNQVGWEVKSASGAAFKTQGIIYANNKPIDTIETDSFGMGVFNITPSAQTVYTVKLLTGTNKGTTYALPKVIPTGAVINIADALANDTLKVQLKSRYNGKYFLLVHNYKQLLSLASLQLSHQLVNVKIDMSAIPRGINVITILDSLQRPCAERLFFAHYTQKPQVSISTDKQEYGVRQKVNMKIKLNGFQGASIGGLVSVACAQDNRYEVKNDNNIEHYVYLQNEIVNLPLKDNLLGEAAIDRKYINELLLIRGWSKYKWLDVMSARPADTIKDYNSLAYKGSVMVGEKKLKKPIDMVLMHDGTIKVISTTDIGLFALTNNDIITPYGKKLWLQVTGTRTGYAIMLKDPYKPVSEMLANNLSLANNYEQGTIVDTHNDVLKGFNHATNLHEVVITAKNDNAIYSAGPNACGDYVCRYGYLNCQNHANEFDNKAPVKGVTYLVHTSQQTTTYTGCVPPLIPKNALDVNSIYEAKEFYIPDYSATGTNETTYLSTLFWKHSVIVNPDKTVELPFYTSDITGKFRIVVQGVTNEDVVYGESSFTVKKK